MGRSKACAKSQKKRSKPLIAFSKSPRVSLSGVWITLLVYVRTSVQSAIDFSDCTGIRYVDA